MLSSTFILLSILGSAFGAANDWSQPCLSGVCFYDLPASETSASGTLKIWGSEAAITDITAAAGWDIIDCEKDTLSQDIRLVCTGDEANCAHLYDDVGAVGKIARLPERCGQNAFARVSRAWVPADQSIPEEIARRMVRRDGVQPQVQALHIDADFSAIDTPQAGPVSFEIQAANVPGADTAVTASSRARERRLFGFIKKAIKAIAALNDVSIDKSQTLPPVSVNKTFNLLDETLSCPPIEGRLKIDVAAHAGAVAAVGVAAEGTIIPPKITDFAITTTLNADLNGVLTLNGSLSGSIDSGKINLFEVGIPGLSFPGILTVGPSFRIDALAAANLDVNADLAVGINYKIEKATLVFPPNNDQGNAGALKLEDTPLKLSVSPSAKVTGTVSAHLIPSINLGISALGGVADASVFLELDASANMALSLEAKADAGVTIGRETATASSTATVASSSGTAAASSTVASSSSAASSTVASSSSAETATSSGAGSATASASSTAAAHETAAISMRSSSIDSLSFLPARTLDNRQVKVTTSAEGTFGGCFSIGAGLAVNAGASAEFFGLFDTGTTFPLFNREFELFKKCFGAQQQRRALRFNRSFVSEEAASLNLLSRLAHLEKRALTCPTAATQGSLVPLADEVVPATSISAL